MSFTDFDWDEHNTGHVARHNVQPFEVEEVMRNEPIRYEEQFDERSGEQRIVELGHTNALRVLFLVWTPRESLIRPVTAFAPTSDIRDEYLAELFGQE